VAGQERDASTGGVTDRDRCRRVAERRVEIDLGRVGDEIVETGAADDPDLSAQLGSPVAERDEHQSLAEPEVDDDVDDDDVDVDVDDDDDDVGVDEPPDADDVDESDEPLVVSPDLPSDLVPDLRLSVL
jgi:hypothetical protein